MDKKEAVPFQYKALYDSVAHAVERKSEARMKAGALNTQDGAHGDSYYFFHFVKAVPYYHESQFKKDLDHLGITNNVWKKIPDHGIGDHPKMPAMERAKGLFELSAHYNNRYVVRHLAEYFWTARDQGITLNAEAGHEDTAETLLREYPRDTEKPAAPPKLDVDTEKLVGRLAEDYYPRAAALKQIKQTLQSAQSGYITLRGGAGAGKSAILADVVRTYKNAPDYDLACHFVKWGYASATSFDFFKNLYRQLKALYPLKTEAPTQSLSPDQYSHWISEALHETGLAFRNRAGKKLFLIIDALDEVDGDDPSNQSGNGNNLLYLPKNLPDGIIILVSCRHAEKQSYQGELLNLSLESDEPHQREDVEGYIKQKMSLEPVKNWLQKYNKTPEEFIKLVCEKSQYRFIYLHHLFHIETGESEASQIMELERFDEDSMPDGIEGYYKTQFERLDILNDAEKLRIFTVLKIFKPDISLERMIMLSGVEAAKLKVFLKPWINLRMIENHFRDDLYWFYGLEHLTFYEYLRDEVPELRYDRAQEKLLCEFGDELRQRYPLTDNAFSMPEGEAACMKTESIRIIPEVLYIYNPDLAASYLVNSEFCQRYIQLQPVHRRKVVGYLDRVYNSIAIANGKSEADDIARKFVHNIISLHNPVITENDWENFTRHTSQKAFVKAVDGELLQRKS